MRKFRLDDSSFENAKITAAIAHTGGNIAQAAKLLGICEMLYGESGRSTD